VFRIHCRFFFLKHTHTHDGMFCTSFLMLYVDVCMLCTSFLMLFVDDGMLCTSFLMLYVDYGMFWQSFLMLFSRWWHVVHKFSDVVCGWWHVVHKFSDVVCGWWHVVHKFSCRVTWNTALEPGHSQSKQTAQGKANWHLLWECPPCSSKGITKGKDLPQNPKMKIKFF